MTPLLPAPPPPGEPAARLWRLAGDRLAQGRTWEAESLLAAGLRQSGGAPPPAEPLRLLAGLWQAAGHGQAAAAELIALAERLGGAEPPVDWAGDLRQAFRWRNHAAQAGRLLAGAPAALAPEAALELARLYLILGAEDLAAEHLAQAREGAPAAAWEQTARLARDLARITGSPTEPAAFDPGENLAALARTQPALAARLAETDPAAEGLRGFTAPGGGWQLVEATGAWLAQDYTLPAEVAAWWARQRPYTPEERASHAILLNGLGTGLELDLLSQLTQGGPGQAQVPIYVVEARPAVLAWHLLHRDLTPLLAAERVFFFAGPGAAEDLWRLFAARPGLKMPSQVHPALPRPGESGAGWQKRGGLEPTALLARLHEARQGAEAPLWQRLQELLAWYEAPPQRDFWERLARKGKFPHLVAACEDERGGPPRLLLLTSRFTAFAQHSVRDCEMAAQNLGWETRLLTEPDDVSSISLAAMVEALEFRPDVFLTVNYPSARLGPARPPRAPFVTWVQDSWAPHLEPEGLKLLAPRDFLIYADVKSLTARGFPQKQLVSSTLVTNPRVYRPLRLSAADQARYGCQVSYVSHQSRLPEEAAAAYRQALGRRYGADTPQARLAGALLETLAAVYAQGGLLRVRQELEDLSGAAWSASSLDPVEKDRLSAEIYNQVNDFYLRHQVLTWVSATGVDFQLWGRGWEKCPPLARHARGVADNGAELCAIYNASQINLQVMCHNGFLHHRFLDGSAAGGFFLLNHHPFVNQAGCLHARLLTLGGGEGAADLGDMLAAAAGEPDLAHFIRELAAKYLALPAAEAAARLREDARFQLRNHELGLAAYFADFLFPQAAEISFRDRADLEAKLARFLADPPARRDLALAARRVVVERFNHTTLFRWMIRIIWQNWKTAALPEEG
ncbi:MAG: glycosyltransferase [Deltaproteobacteria bacterium]|nr:glycosyltransferase [Deltaproteobacteria bacterium]